MTTNDWERLKPLFAEANSMTPHAKAAFLEELRRKDEGLGRKLEDLLRETDGGFLDQPLIDLHNLFDAGGETRSGTYAAVQKVIANRFRIVRMIGRGGMGEVFEAEDQQLQDRVALKVIRPDIAAIPSVAERFKREILLGKRIAHPNVCRIHDLGTERCADGSELLFLTMEFLDGETLSARLRRGPMGMPEALPLLKNMADGLSAAHEAGVVHRDFKCGNVMLAGGSGQLRAVITDFGLARAVQESGEGQFVTRPGAPAGTVAYMAPEQIRGETAQPAADIYALGVVAYQMVTGKLPFEGETDIGVAHQHLHAAPPPPCKIAPELSRNWEAAILRCLRKAPKERFPSAEEFKKALGEDFRPGRASWLALFRRYSRWAGVAACMAAAVWAARLLWPVGPKVSPAALRWYSLGVDAIREGTFYKAVRLLEQSLKEAPGYPLTHASLAEAWLALDAPERAAEEMLRADGPGRDGGGIGPRERARLQAIHYSVTRDYTKAAAEFRHLEESASTEERPRALVDLGRALERAKDPKKAIDAYQIAVKMDANYAGGWLRLAVVEGQLKQPDKMAEALGKAEELYEASSNLEGVTEVYYQRGAYAIEHARLSDAAEWLEKARQSARAVHNPQQEIRALYCLGKVAYETGEPGVAQQLAEDAIREARANNLEFIAESGYRDLGNAAQTLGNFTKAAEYFNELLRISRKYRNGYLEASARYSLGTLANREHPDESGAHEVEQALAWFNGNGYSGEAWKCLVMLGRFRRDRGDLAGAADAFKKLLEIARAAHNDQQTAYALSSVGSVLLRQERYPEALENIKQWLETSLRMGDKRLVVYAEAALARVYCEMGMFLESGEQFALADAAARKGGMEELLVNLAVTRLRTLLLSGRPGEAAVDASRFIRSYRSKYPVDAAEALGIQASARGGESVALRSKWCEEALTLARGSAASRTALLLTKADLFLEAKNFEGVLDLYPELRAAVERQSGQYSLFRAELAAAQAYRALGREHGGAAGRASAALDKFQKQFAKPDWDKFQGRADFRRNGKNLLKLHPSML